MFDNWQYNKNEPKKAYEYYGRVLDIDKESSKLLILVSSDEEIIFDNIYCFDFDPKDYRWYLENKNRQKFFNEERNKANSEKGNLPLKNICGSRVEIITSFNDRPISLKTKAI